MFDKFQLNLNQIYKRNGYVVCNRSDNDLCLSFHHFGGIPKVIYHSITLHTRGKKILLMFCGGLFENAIIKTGMCHLIVRQVKKVYIS